MAHVWLLVSSAEDMARIPFVFFVTTIFQLTAVLRVGFPLQYNPREMGSSTGRFTASGNSETSITSTNEKLLPSSAGHQQPSSQSHADPEQEREQYIIYQQQQQQQLLQRQHQQAQNPPTIAANTVPPYPSIWILPPSFSFLLSSPFLNVPSQLFSLLLGLSSPPRCPRCSILPSWTQLPQSPSQR